MDKDTEKIRKLIADELRIQLKSELFSARKITDTPTDDLMVVNRKYVNLNGLTSQRPVSSIIGQQYFDTTLGYPIFKNQNYRWVNSVGSVLG